MFNIGDVVQYENYIGVVTDDSKLTLALNTGQTVSPPAVAEINLLTSYKDVIDQLERSILNVNR